MSLFDEIINCSDCPKIEDTNGVNRKGLESHLNTVHGGAPVEAHIIAVADRCKAEREWINATYDSAKDYLDSNFTSKFLIDFFSCCWELCVYQYLIDNGIKVYKTSQAAGPDFDTSIGYVECVAVKRGDGRNAIPLLKASTLQDDGTWSNYSGAQTVPTNEAQLRISNGVSEKIRKYHGYVDGGIINSVKPRLIALNWFAEGSSFSATSNIMNYHPVMRTLFAVGPTQITIDAATGNSIDSLVSRQPTIPNANGTHIDMMYFMKPIENDRDRIDGVIVSEKAPYIYEADKFQLINNPFANGFNVEQFSIGKKIKAVAHDKGVTISKL